MPDPHSGAHGNSPANAPNDAPADAHPVASPDVWSVDRPVQDAWPANTCYGCGRANPDGLHAESTLSSNRDALVATFEPEPTHSAGYPNFAYGGLLASLADCHAIWTAITFRYAVEDRPLLSDPLCMYVTGELNVRYLAPTPLDEPIHLEARVDGDVGRRVDVVCDLGPESGDEPTVRARATAVEMQDPPALDAASDWPHALH